MGQVFERGFTDENCYASDIFPLRVNLDPSECDNPFTLFPMFEQTFLEHLHNFLKLGGDVLLVLGKVTFNMLEEWLDLEAEEFGKSNSHLKVYTERVSNVVVLD